jgi:nucleotide-binding universal stress UspA family protein
MPVSRPRPWTGKPVARPVVLGVHLEQPSRVVHHAVGLADALSTGLVCVWADTSHVLAAQGSDGSVSTVPLDPDQADLEAGAPETELVARLETELAGWNGSWRFVYAVGDVAHVLGATADAYDAPLVAVGTRRPGFGGWMNELIGGSVAGRLAHTQSRPVLMIPGAPHGVPE